jgi:hypothetical protein
MPQNRSGAIFGRGLRTSEHEGYTMRSSRSTLLRPRTGALRVVVHATHLAVSMGICECVSFPFNPISGDPACILGHMNRGRHPNTLPEAEQTKCSSAFRLIWSWL